MDADSLVPDITPDEVDGALEDLWRGRSAEFERLLNRSGEPTPGVGGLFGLAAARGLPAMGADAVPVIPEYEVLRELGRGGMGVVYEARQLHPERSVALKVIRAGGAPSTQQVKLFEREIRSLARLRHPNIAAIYDAGFTADGRPYFAMELVQGMTLLEYMRGESLPGLAQGQRVRAQLALFERICETIHFAHQRGVIHRDLKPSNLLVAPGEPGSASGTGWESGPQLKVLDFGLARITDGDTPDTMMTDEGQLRGTLAYMSPEQVQGEQADVDTRGDVYALGVILFELLTGSLPYNVKDGSLPQKARVICESPPRRPSEFNPVFRGDLETIILKAIAKDRDQRYPSANALAEDIGRFRADLPILARPQSAIYQLRKLVARHRVASYAVLAVLVVAVAGFAVSATLYAGAERARASEATQRRLAEEQRDHAVAAERRAEAHRMEATSEARRAAAVTSFVSEMLSAADPGNSGRDVKVIEVLDSAAERLAAAPDPVPEVEATIRHVIGMTYMNLGLPQKAEPQFRAVADIRLAQLGLDDEDTLVTRENLAAALSALNKHEEAVPLARESLQRLMAIKGEGDVAVLRSMNSLGMILYASGKLDEAEEWVRRAVDGQVKALGDEHKDTLVSMSGLGIILQEKGRYEEAETLFRHVAELRRGQFPEEHPRLLVAEENLASVLHDQGMLVEAEAIYNKLLQSSRRVLGDEHTRTLVLINSLAQVYEAQKKFEPAEQYFRENYETRARVFGSEQQGTLVAINNLASLYQKMERFHDAEVLMRETLAIGVEILPEDHWYLAVFHNNLGKCLMQLGQGEEAARELKTAHAGFVRAFGADHPRAKQAEELLRELNERAQAESDSTEARVFQE